jgi:hypothetical protein
MDGYEPRYRRVSPVIRGTGPDVTAGDWFESCGRPLTLRMALPLSAELVVAALYATPGLVTVEDLADDDDLWGLVALAVVQHGLKAIEKTRDDIADAEQRGRMHHRGGHRPGWLETCRRRVAEVTGAAVVSGPVSGLVSGGVA